MDYETFLEASLTKQQIVDDNGYSKIVNKLYNEWFSIKTDKQLEK
jgi:hypothetical protein